MSNEKPTSFVCHDCRKLTMLPTEPGPSGYATVDEKGISVVICYDCAAVRDKEYMRTHDHMTLYVKDANDSKGLPDSRYVVTNWPGTLRFDVIRDKKTRHNWRVVGDVLHVWFVFEGRVWYGRHVGDNEIVHCRKTNKKA